MHTAIGEAPDVPAGHAKINAADFHVRHLLGFDDGVAHVFLGQGGIGDFPLANAPGTGLANADDVQVIEGLNEGDKVVSSGAYGLPDKTKIKIEAAGAPAEEAKPSADRSKAPSEGSGEK